MEYITNRDQLRQFATRHGLRRDWHEPDEQGVSAMVVGGHLDNAGFYGPACPMPERQQELHVILAVVPQDAACDDCGHAKGEDVAVVNLATLLAWAAEQ